MIFNTALPKSMPFVNGMLKKKGLQQLVQRCYLTDGLETTVEMLDGLKQMGFTYATRSGMSIGIEDLIIPQDKAELVRRRATRSSRSSSSTSKAPSPTASATTRSSPCGRT